METEKRKRTSMSIVEMGKELGICKTEAYRLVNKQYFQTITVGNAKRVLIDSFDKWYANQVWYKKVDGTPPGQELEQTTYSVDDVAAILGISQCIAYELIGKGHFVQVEIPGKCRITKESFNKWYQGQSIYRTAEDQAKDNELMTETLSLPEIARILGTHRNNVYNMVYRKCFEVVQIGRYKRVPKASFDKWLKSQKRYQIHTDAVRKE